MKSKLFILIFIISSWMASGEEFPDINKSFKNATLIAVTEIDPFNEIMTFASNDSFDDLKTQVREKLGEGWIESPEKNLANKKVKDDDLKVPGPPSFDLAGNTVFISRKFPNAKIRLTVFKIKTFKTKHSVILAIERKKPQKKGN
ncbi:MAG: hypothetical protein ACON38_12990 [Akkermansiaceae bacterium]